MRRVNYWWVERGTRGTSAARARHERHSNWATRSTHDEMSEETFISRMRTGVRWRRFEGDVKEMWRRFEICSKHCPWWWGGHGDERASIRRPREPNLLLADKLHMTNKYKTHCSHCTFWPKVHVRGRRAQKVKSRRLQAERLPHAKPSECRFHDRNGKREYTR